MSFFGIDLPSAAGNILGGVATKIGEAASQAVSSFAKSNPFSKIAAGASDLKTAASNLLFSASDVASATGTTLSAAIPTATDLLANFDPLTYNSMTAAYAGFQLNTAGDGTVTGRALNAAANNAAGSDEHFVKLTEVSVNSDGSTGAVILFPNMPDISENRTIDFEAIAPAQSPGAFMKYKGTAPVQWSINATLTSRTTEEATSNLRIINTLRGWTMPYFGQATAEAYPGKLGAPPPIIVLSGYAEQIIGPSPCVMTAVNWSFPQDVDYIPANELVAGGIGTKLVPFPAVMKITISLTESFSTDQFNGFNLAEFKLGNKMKAFKARPTLPFSALVAAGAPTAEAQTILPNSIQSPISSGATGIGSLPASLRGANGYTAVIGSDRTGATAQQINAANNDQVAITQASTSGVWVGTHAQAVAEGQKILNKAKTGG